MTETANLTNRTGVRFSVPDHGTVGAGETAAFEPSESVEELVQAGALGPDPAAPLERLTVEELQALADARGLTVEGTGQGGNVIKADLLAALAPTTTHKES